MPVPQSFIVAAKRTPFGAFGGKLRGFTATQLGGMAGKAALAELPKDLPVDQVFFGNVTASDITAPYFARHVGHLSGCGVSTPALTINRLCGSGIQSLINAVQTISLGEAHVVLSGGAENMSHSPFMLNGETRWGTKYGKDLVLQDSLAGALVDHNTGHGEKTPMGITAENLAKKYGITREDCDAYAAQSQARWAAANSAGAFTAELTSVPVPDRKNPNATMTVDEHPRPQTSLDSLAKLRPVFEKTGTVTAGNASGISDGAAANVVVSEEAVKRYGLKPLARVAGYAWSACEPATMGMGPVESCRVALQRAGKTMADMDLMDVNEAFAAQWLAVQKVLEMDNEKSNMFGGAIALGHPLAASGARIIANLTHNLHRMDKKWAIGSACIGGGQGVAVVLERV